MIKVCLIRGSKDYIAGREYTYGKQNKIILEKKIEDWENSLQYDYWDFRSKIRDIVIRNIIKQKFDLVFYNYMDFLTYFMSNKIEEDILFYGQDDDDLIINKIEDKILYKESYLYIWDWFYADLISKANYVGKDGIIQSNHSLFYITKEDFNKYFLVSKSSVNSFLTSITELPLKNKRKNIVKIINPFKEKFRVISRFLKKEVNSLFLINRFLKKNLDHLYHHNGIDFILKSSNVLQHYSKKIHTINFNHISSITNLRRIEDMNLIKFSVEECINSLDHLINEYNLDNEEIFELKNLYNKLL